MRLGYKGENSSGSTYTIFVKASSSIDHNKNNVKACGSTVKLNNNNVSTVKSDAAIAKSNSSTVKASPVIVKSNSITVKHDVAIVQADNTSAKFVPTCHYYDKKEQLRPRCLLSKWGIPHGDLHLRDIVDRQSTYKPSSNNSLLTMDDDENVVRRRPEFDPAFLDEAYERCRCICAEYAKTFYLGTRLMTKERQRAIWAIYGGQMNWWMVQMQIACVVWEFWTDGKIDLKISSMEDLTMNEIRHKEIAYENFQELYLYCYYVAGTVGLMSVPVMGIAPESPASVHHIYDAALYLGIGNQLTNILRDVGEDASRGRVYLPQDELAQFGLCNEDVYLRKVSNGWREFMKEQITRARFYFNLAEEGAYHLDKASRWPVWSALMLYKKILDAIEENDYDNLTKRAYVGKTKKLLMLPLAYSRSIAVPAGSVV
ncbi:hypothetical protein Sjap_012990 [Stephania japonica]|uniref:15-cis-phytoene synthase n=1 Tax=Stephania japonica TaxID=461633 RepID=A0AAP0IXA1_9MAGN